MRTWAAGLLALTLALALATPAGAATRRQLQESAFAVPTPTAPIRDAVIQRPNRAYARAVGSAAPLARYPVNDGSGGSVEIVNDCVPVVCQATPEDVANLLGTLPHRDEINLLTVFLETPSGVAAMCGGDPNVQACYYPGFDQMVINGNTSPAPDGASWKFVVAHEYGHHLASHRNNAPFDNPAVDWGPKNWASWAGVCPGVRAGSYFPGDEGGHYFENPGEAFAEAYAHNAFQGEIVPWHWSAFPAPDPNAYAAIQQDALNPWNGAGVQKRRGHFPRKRKRPKRKSKQFSTPRDGDATISLSGPNRADLSLKLFSGGQLIGRSDGVGSQESVSYRICGERSVTAVVRRHGRRLTRYRLTGLIP